MNSIRNLAAAVTALALAAAACPPASARTGAIAEHHAAIADQRFRYLEAGAGETLVVLLHGWPEDASEWRQVMPALAMRHRVVAIDLPGIGGSTSASRDFSKVALARELHGLVAGFRARRVVLVGHDIGGMVAYAYARQFPGEVAGVAILDVPLPGLAPWKMVEALPQAWHFRFHAQQPLAEQLVDGRQARYFRYFIDHTAADPKAIGDTDVAGYAAAYGSEDRLAAGFGFYRAFAQDEAFNGAERAALAVPILVAGADHSLGAGADVLAQDLRDHGASNVRSAQIKGSGHWVAEEQPAQVVTLIDELVATLAGTP